MHDQPALLESRTRSSGLWKDKLWLPALAIATSVGSYWFVAARIDAPPPLLEEPSARAPAPPPPSAASAAAIGAALGAPADAPVDEAALPDSALPTAIPRPLEPDAFFATEETPPRALHLRHRHRLGRIAAATSEASEVATRSDAIEAQPLNEPAADGGGPIAIAAAVEAPAPAPPLTPPAHAAHRALEQRALHASIQDLTVHGPLVTSEVRRAVARILPQLSACRANSNDGEEGAIHVDISIDEVGRVRSPNVTGSSGPVDRCFAAVATKLVARAPDTGTARVSWSVAFER